jgi:hypothetical protein
MTSFFIYLLKVSILSALFIGLFHLLLRRETFHRTNRIILVSSLVLSYILPLCVITVHRQGNPSSRPIASRNIQDEKTITKEPFEPVITTGSVYASEPEVNSESAAAAENLTQVIEVTGNDRTAEPVVKKQRVRINWWKLLGAVYVIGLLCVLIIRLISTSKVIRIIRKGNVIEENRDCTVISTPQAEHSFSWMKYIVLPEKGTEAGQVQIMDHEKAHLAHHHSEELLLTDLLSALQWFNPALLLFRHDLSSLHEYQADSDVLDKGYDRRQYQYLLLDCATDKTEFRAANTFRKSTLEGRIDMINKKKSSGSSILKLAYIPVLLLFALNVFAEKVYDNDLTEVIEVDNYVRIDGLWYKFKEGNQVRVVSRKTEHAYPEHIVVPDTIIYKNVKYPVTSIGTRAFNFAQDIKSIKIPATIKEIEDYSFYECTHLEEVSLPASIIKIGNRAFYNCYNLKSINIPAHVKLIGDMAFSCCGLESITVEPDNQFYDSRENCNAVIETSSGALIIGSASTVIPTGVTEIANAAFSGNSKLKSIIIPPQVTSIGNYAFRGCSALKSIVIPETVKKLDYGCFTESGIKNVTINGNIELTRYAFTGCDSLENITYGPGATEIDIPLNCRNLKKLFIPATVRKIDYIQDSRNLELESIVVEKGNPVFDSRENCNAIIETATGKLIFGCRNTVIPGSVKSIQDYAFTGGHITELHIPASVTYIGQHLFEGIFNFNMNTYGNYRKDLTVITVDPGNPVYDSRGGCNAVIERSTNTLVLACKSTFIPSSVTCIGQNAFMNLDDLTEITIPDAVTTILDDAFSGCTNLEKITIGAGLTEMIHPGFNYSTNITDIWVSPNNRKYDSRNDCNAVIETSTNTLILGSANTIVPDGVTTIGKSAFSSNTKLTSLTLPPSVTAIEPYAFYRCSNLEEINLENVTIKSDDAFDGCAFTRTERADSINGYLAFYLQGKEAILNYISENAPKSITIPATFTYKEKEYTVTEIGAEVCRMNTGIESISIPATVRIIGNKAFSECYKLKSVRLADGLKNIQDEAFANCRNLETIKLPSTLVHIGQAAFTRSGLKSLDIPQSVTSMGRNITLDCKNLKSLSVNPGNKVFDSRNRCNAIIKTDSNILLEGCNTTKIPQGIIAIGPYAFAGATGFKTVDIPRSVRYILEGAFAFCPLKKISIPASVTLLYDNPFLGCSDVESITVQEGNPVYSSPAGSNAIISNGNDVRVIREVEVTEMLDYFHELKYLDRRPATLIHGCRNTVIPSSANVIGYRSFAFCNGLESMVIPESVTTVEHDAFLKCPDLKELVIPASVTKFAKSDYCPNLEKIIVSDANPVYDSRDKCNAVIETEDDNLIIGCMKTVIPSTVKYIDGHAFEHVHGLKSVIIPNSVERIGYDAFWDCADLESVTISSSVRYLGASSWEEDPDEKRQRNPFFNCPNLKHITVDKANPYFDSRENCNAIISKSTRILIVGCRGTVEPESMSSIGPNAYTTIEKYVYEPDYLSTSWIFPDGDMSHSYFAEDDDD